MINLSPEELRSLEFWAGLEKDRLANKVHVCSVPKPQWRTEPREICRQVDNGTPQPTGVRLSVDQFQTLFPNYRTSMTTICSPEVHNWIAIMQDGSSLWIGVKDSEVNPQNWATT